MEIIIVQWAPKLRHPMLITKAPYVALRIPLRLPFVPVLEVPILRAMQEAEQRMLAKPRHMLAEENL